MTKKQESMVAQYNRATARTLDDVYGRCSKAKRQAMQWCLDRQNALSGRDGRVTSASSCFFSYAFRYEKNGEERLWYATGRNVYDFTI